MPQGGPPPQACDGGLAGDGRRAATGQSGPRPAPAAAGPCPPVASPTGSPPPAAARRAPAFRRPRDAAAPRPDDEVHARAVEGDARRPGNMPGRAPTSRRQPRRPAAPAGTSLPGPGRPVPAATAGPSARPPGRLRRPPAAGAQRSWRPEWTPPPVCSRDDQAEEEDEPPQGEEGLGLPPRVGRRSRRPSRQARRAIHGPPRHLLARPRLGPHSRRTTLGAAGTAARAATRRAGGGGRAAPGARRTPRSSRPSRCGPSPRPSASRAISSSAA